MANVADYRTPTHGMRCFRLYHRINRKSSKAFGKVSTEPSTLLESFRISTPVSGGEARRSRSQKPRGAGESGQSGRGRGQSRRGQLSGRSTAGMHRAGITGRVPGLRWDGGEAGWNQVLKLDSLLDSARTLPSSAIPGGVSREFHTSPLVINLIDLVCETSCFQFKSLS